MRSNKPYLIRAFYEWIIDNGCTPFLMVNAFSPNCKVPVDFIQNGEITFNILPEAIRELKLGNDAVEFRASFSGIVHVIFIPISAVLAVYAQENGQGMFFDYDEEDEGNAEWGNAPIPQNQAEKKDKSQRHLKLVE